MPTPKRPQNQKPAASAPDAVAAGSKPKKAPALAGRARAATKKVVSKKSTAKQTPKPASSSDQDAPLARYHAKRDFTRTPEPAGAVAEAAGFSYVIHKHWASHLHYDLRLELGGTMRSWAVPKGPSLDPRDKRLAVQVEDHPISYNDFEGQIPAGQYGGGRVIIWDRGSWSPAPGHDAQAGLAAGNFKFALHGDKLQGGWALVRLKDSQPGKANWLLIKEKDAFARPASEFNVTEALPDSVGPANPRAEPDAILADTVRQIRARKAKTADSASNLPRVDVNKARAAIKFEPRQDHPLHPQGGEGGVRGRARSGRGGGDSVAQSPSPQPSPAGGRGSKKSVAESKSAPLPDLIAPQLATLASDPPPDAANWLWELKFDGYRLLARIHAGRAQLFTRNGLDWSARMPALVRALAALPVQDAWLDGEVVMPGADGLPDFGALQNAFDGRKTDALVYYAFDLLWLDGQDWRPAPLLARRARLAELLRAPPSPMLRLSEHLPPDPHSLLASACKLGMEGVIGKRASAAYRSGRSADWIKLKCGQGDEFIIAGFTAGRGARAAAGDIGALVLAAPTADGGLRWAGNVGSGFDGRTLALLKKRLTPLITPDSPLAEGERVNAPSAITWARPELVAQIAHAGVTQGGHLRHPVFQGLRQDKSVAELRADAVSGSNQPLALARPARAAMKTVTNAAKTDGPVVIAGQTITHPERVIDPASGATKLDLARYYATVAPLILPHLAQRPVALLRAPDGIGGEQFFQKHSEARALPGVTLLDAALDPGHAPLLEIGSEAALLGVVQMNTVELHTWNATRDKIERPDRFVLDLDPGDGVAWPQVQEAAQLVRTLLTELGLVPFLKTSGGKGLHVVTPIKRLYDWDTVKAFSKQLVEHLARLMPDRFTAVSGPKNRVGKIYPDYLRNARGATTVCAWSVRARPGLGVSVPVAWDELAGLTGAAQWTVGNIEERLRVGNGVWEKCGDVARGIGEAITMLKRERI